MTGEGTPPVPDDWAGLMGVLVPGRLAAEPICPTGGHYTWNAAGGARCNIAAHNYQLTPVT
ncbi:MAG TPA: hypothetical protein VLH18_05600, partial [Candidatus Limnocylindrales bacterium]|nr:hypothetical protein [Candidatus Limnocylindrales bacterium]